MNTSSLQRDVLDFIQRAYAPDDPSALEPPTRATREAFLDLAARVLEHQRRLNAPYARYLRSFPEVDTPLDAPPVPTALFKRAELTTFDPRDAAITFRSSGTTEAERGRHHLRSLDLARAAIPPPFLRYMLPDRARITMLVLTPPHADARDSSLAFMLELLLERFGSPGSRHAIAEGALDLPAIDAALHDAQRSGEPLFLLGPSFAFVHLLDARPALSVALPEGSRLFETGGFKGRSRAVPRPELHAELTRALGLHPDMIAAEYGMSELSSQLYERTIRRACAGHATHPGPRLLSTPPWCAARVLDVDTLRPLPHGEVGLIAFFDLANLDSVSPILTGDLGRMHPGDDDGAWRGLPPGVRGLELLGRAPQSTPKGCSIAIDDLLSQP